jgi:hypothetical protein
VAEFHNGGIIMILSDPDSNQSSRSGFESGFKSGSESESGFESESETHYRLDPDPKSDQK